MATFSKWAKIASRASGQGSRPHAVLPQFLERLSVSIRSAKARAVLRRRSAEDNVFASLVANALSALAT